MAAAEVRIGYLASRYPAVSHTFIAREVAALRRQGLVIDTFSVRRTSDEALMSDGARQERERTWSILPRPLSAIAAAHVRAALRRPAAYLRTMKLAQQHRMPGARQALWALFHFGEAMVLADELSRRRIGHLHCHFSNVGGDIGLLATRFLDIGWSLTLHGSADFASATTPLLRQKLGATTFCACVCRHGREQACGLAAPVDRDRITVVRCGLDLARFPFRARPRAPGRLRLVSVGRLSPEKGQVGLLEALALITGRGVDAELRLVGDGPERGRLEAAAARLQMAARCTFTGALSEAAVAEELAGADLFVLTSFIEGLPVVLMEAMAVGLPVVAPRLCGIPELVEDGRTGTLFETGDWNQLAARIEALAADEAGREAMARAGRARIEEEFAIDVAVLPLVQRFRSTVA